jgi:hypothetical protein
MKTRYEAPLLHIFGCSEQAAPLAQKGPL